MASGQGGEVDGLTPATPPGWAWYCVYSKPRGELEAAEHLQRQGFECFLPRIAEVRLRRGRRQRIVEPLFPRYLFLRAEAAVQNLAVVRSTRGVAGFVRFGGEIALVPEALITALRESVDADQVVLGQATGLQPGDAVRVTEGPLLGLEGVFTARQGEHRVEILLSLLGAERRVRVPEAWVEPQKRRLPGVRAA